MTTYKLICGNSKEELKKLEENSFDSIVCDPPYELGFMGKSWDKSGIANDVELWKEALRVLKPGGHLLAFSGSRTYHRMTCAIEDAGFEIRDQIMWLYGSGFPKSHDVSKGIDKAAGAKRAVIGKNENFRPLSGVDYALDGESKNFRQTVGMGNITAPSTDAAKQWQGWGSALKPAHEPIVIARKPLAGTIAENVMQHGTGALNIDGCRILTNDKLGGGMVSKGRPKASDGWDRPWMHNFEVTERKKGEATSKVAKAEELGRWPANVIHDGSDVILDGFPKTGNGNNKEPFSYKGKEYNNKDTSMFNGDKPNAPSNYNDSCSAARFFYCAKANKNDRNEGLDAFDKKLQAGAEFRPNHMDKALNGEDGNPYGRYTPTQNNHPTVKPTELMRYLCRLVTPPNGTVLDPFMGSGSTGKACMYENFNFVGIDLSDEYVKIAEARIKFVKGNQTHRFTD